MQGAVDEHAGVVQRAPQQRRLPVVAHEHRHDRRDDRRSTRRVLGAGPDVRTGSPREHAVAELVQPVGAGARAFASTAASSGGPSGERTIRSAASAAPSAAGTAEAVNRNAREEMRR